MATLEPDDLALKKGTAELLVLAQLEGRARHGYDIAQRIADRSEGAVTFQAASLYPRRIEWYDTHAWPPEDLAALKGALGDDFVHVRPGLESPLPLVLPRCSRRSRFSDKLVDLAAARFTEHDFQRWGRLWWWRLEDVARRPGDHKQELQPLLTGPLH